MTLISLLNFKEKENSTKVCLPQIERKNRSKTFPGIAKAMAEQWGDYIKENNHEDEGF